MIFFMIRRPLGSNRYIYLTEPNAWGKTASVAYKFSSQVNANQFIRSNRSYLGPDDEVVEFLVWNGRDCQQCSTYGSVRHVGTDREPEQVRLDFICNVCRAESTASYQFANIDYK